ncbi:MAG: DUF4160 domain-containing protein [Bacteroidales bacterium]|nr:DUF4160 domain-containing protein [Bacteroidales bacterium]
MNYANYTVYFRPEILFYSEEHLPIHIHVQSADGRAKINVRTLEVMDNKGVKPKDLKKSTTRPGMSILMNNSKEHGS